VGLWFVLSVNFKGEVFFAVYLFLGFFYLRFFCFIDRVLVNTIIIPYIFFICK
jgi:hypothetical protein